MITLRYSLNFARYGRPVWNHADLAHPGIGYGYTSVLWMLINLVPALFTHDKDLLLQISRLVPYIPAAIIALILVSGISRMKAPLIPRVAVTAAIFSVSLYGFHVNTGMETMAFCCFVLLAVVPYGRQRTCAMPYLFANLAFLTRPEGAMVVFLICVLDIRSRNYRRATAGFAAFAVTALVLGILLQSAHGHFLPNSFYVKQTHGINQPSLIRTLWFLGTVALPFVPLAALSVYRVKDAAAVRSWYAALLLMGYYLTVTNTMNTMYRFQMPVLVLLTYAGLPAIEMVLVDWKRWRVLGVAGLLSACACDVYTASESMSWSGWYGRTVASFISLGKAMKDHQVEGRRLMFDWAGAVPYFSDWDTCEELGLTDYELATRKTRLRDIVQDPGMEVVILYMVVNRPFPVRDTARRLSYMDFIPPGDERRTSLMTYPIVGDVPVMIDGVRKFSAIRVLARHPAAMKAMLSELKLNPNISSGSILP